MRADPRSHDLVAPDRLADALALLADGSRRPLAGGTDLMVLYAAGKLPPARLVGLWQLDELRGITVDADAFTIGALTSYTAVREHQLLSRELPMLAAAARETGGLAIQNRGTLGGNIANASPAADSVPPLLAYGAELELVSQRGSRWVAYDGFHTGYKQTIMQPGELIARIRLGRPRAARSDVFRKIGPRKAQAISKICLAACLERDAAGRIIMARLAFGGVGPVVLRAPAAELALRAGDRAAVRAGVAAAITPIDDIRSTARYRLTVAQNLAEDLLR
jgi:CO/xanthine dehydrogenase FAD-binding subunit